MAVFPAVTLLVFLAPVLAGLIGTLLPALGYLPAIGGNTLSLAAFERLLSAPGLLDATLVTLGSGFAATLISLGLTVLLFAAGHDTRVLAFLRQAMTPLLAVPHAASAIGFAFLIAPSGWLARLVSPWPSGWTTPPDVATVQDPYGLALTLGLVMKETPFLILMTFAALAQVQAGPKLKAAYALGYGPAAAWLKVVFPLVYPQIRLAVWAVLAYGLSVVDMAMILGPTTPPTLSLLVLRWAFDPDLSFRFQAAAGAIGLLGLALAAIALWRGGEVLIAHAARPWLTGGHRGQGRSRWGAWSALSAFAALWFGSLASLALWSVAGAWRYPDSLPEEVSLAPWFRHLNVVGDPLSTTLGIGIAAAMIGLVLVAGCLENEAQRGRPAGRGSLVLIYLPLIMPQIGFLFGVQILLLWWRLDGTWMAVVWAHLLFVVPYVFLALSEPYRSLDPRYARTALTLGRSPLEVWLRIKLPLLTRPLAVALAIGFAVSVAQYLPTIFAGGGRFATLTTEAVSFASGANRRIASMVAFTLALLPLLGFALALVLPAARLRLGRLIGARP